MDKNLIWAWAVNNSAAIICWCVLALHFEKWWLALLAALFTSSLKVGKDNQND